MQRPQHQWHCAQAEFGLSARELSLPPGSVRLLPLTLALPSHCLPLTFALPVSLPFPDLPPP